VTAPVVRIREAGPDDVPALRALLAQLAEPGTVGPDVAQAATLLARIQSSPDHRIYLAECAGEPAGAYALLIMTSLAHPGRPAAIVEDVVVDAAQRGRGIGRQMMADAIARARARHCYKLALSSNAQRSDAHRFYETLGFERHGLSFAVFLDET
jgi:GNAT superfamily N-acetyltransferase